MFRLFHSAREPRDSLEICGPYFLEPLPCKNNLQVRAISGLYDVSGDLWHMQKGSVHFQRAVMVDIGKRVDLLKSQALETVFKCQVDRNKGVGCAPVFPKESVAEVNAIFFFCESCLTDKGFLQAHTHSPA